ncbi:hypothetical protein HU200_067683 [Digitaria exilis]|uniref:RING-CH-type domain-containing protein n=1 Tax=Digitaria exilis TaxID=1010633 RepID=A0A834ZZJ3_9POAL|nr:hypothetical protein HU200_067683 [Digitaria exilis]
MEGEELQIQNHGGTASAEEEQNKPLSSMTSSLLPAHSLRSTAMPAAQAQSLAMGDLGIRSLSFSKLFSFRMASSLRISDYTDQPNHATATSNSSLDNNTKEDDQAKKVCRSQSVPTSVKRFKPTKGLRRVADSSSLSPAPAGTLRIRVVPGDIASAAATASADQKEEDIAAEEAVCRICMVALSEGAVLKLECSCKGELALAHRACAIKWFSIKGNGTCDVCSQEVLNLPVTLRRLHDLQAQGALLQADTTATATATTTGIGGRYGSCKLMGLSAGWRPWHSGAGHLLALRLRPRPFLLSDHNQDGVKEIRVDLLSIAVPLHRALHPPLLQIRKILCVSAGCVHKHVIEANLDLNQVRMQAVIAIILSTFAGFSVAICTNSVLLQILKWRASYVASTTNAEDGHGSREPSAADLEIALPPP